MTTAARRQREVLQREQHMVQVARTLARKHGYLGLNMDLVATAAEYSKGLMYKHFTCKEDLLGAISAEHHRKRIELFERGALFRGRPRERMTAISVADAALARREPDFFQTEHLLNTPDIAEKVSEKRRTSLESLHQRCWSCVLGIVRDGVAGSDLELPPDAQPEHVVCGWWALTIGTHTLARSQSNPTRLGLGDPLRFMWHNQQVLLDGYRWRPLSREHDYAALRERIWREVFGEEGAADS